MAIIHKYSELALFLILNIFLALPGLFSNISLLDEEKLKLFHSGFTFIFYFKFMIFDFLYQRKSLEAIHKFFDKLLSHSKLFLFVFLISIIIDIILSKYFPNAAPFLESLKNPDKTSEFIATASPFLFSGVSFSYLGFWIIRQFRKFKNRFILKNHLAKFRKVVLYKLLSPSLFFVLFSIIICGIPKCTFESFGERVATIISIPFFWFFAALLLPPLWVILPAMIIPAIFACTKLFKSKLTPKNKAFILKSTKFCRIIQIFTFLLSSSLFILLIISLEVYQ